MTEERKQLALFARGQLSAEDKISIEDAGYIAVEVDDPSAVVLLAPSVPLLGSDDLLMSALKGIVDYGSSAVGQEFVKELHKRLKAAEAIRTAAGGGGAR